MGTTKVMIDKAVPVLPETYRAFDGLEVQPETRLEQRARLRARNAVLAGLLDPREERGAEGWYRSELRGVRRLRPMKAR